MEFTMLLSVCLLYKNDYCHFYTVDRQTKHLQYLEMALCYLSDFDSQSFFCMFGRRGWGVAESLFGLLLGATKSYMVCC